MDLQEQSQQSQTQWKPLDPKIYAAMHVIIAEAEMNIPDYKPQDVKDELLLITGLLNAIGYFTKLAWDDLLAKEQKKHHSSRLTTAWWQLVHNSFDEVPTKENMGASDSEIYDWNRLSAVIVRYYLNYSVMGLTAVQS